MNFSHWPREACIHLLDTDEDSDINVKCSMVTIPRLTPRVITTNHEPPMILAAYDKAIQRRIQTHEITEDLRSKAPKEETVESVIEDSCEIPLPLWELQDQLPLRPTCI